MSVALPPDDPSELEDFPFAVLRANQPLARIHREVNDTQWFSSDGSGRFDPPAPVRRDYGTCYLSTLPLGAFVEAFGRIKTIHREHLDERVLARAYLSSDVLLADVTNGLVLGQWQLTAEMSITPAYDVTQMWGHRFFQAGFGGVSYAARHDPTLNSRSVALFGKPGAQPDAFIANTDAIPTDLEGEARRTFGFRIAPSTRIN